jgi:hypothetical protein
MPIKDIIDSPLKVDIPSDAAGDKASNGSESGYPSGDSAIVPMVKRVNVGEGRKDIIE